MFKLHTIFSPFFYIIILHFCRGNPNCNWASMPSGLLAQLTTLRKKEYGSLFSLEAFEFCGSSLPDEHNTLPKSTRRNVKLNKFVFGTQWLYQIYYVNIIYVISMEFLSLHCRRSSLQNIASSEEWGDMAVFTGKFPPTYFIYLTTWNFSDSPATFKWLPGLCQQTFPELKFSRYPLRVLPIKVLKPTWQLVISFL